MDFSACLDYLYGLQRFGIKLGLENMQALKACLPTLQEPSPCIHVAGTNGKGSVSALLAEILRHSGLRVGLYTSPHLHCFTERIRIDNEPITCHEMVHLTETVRQAAGNLPVTFFEATTAMALLAFKERQVDIAVIETGLGGRLDATNIVEPLLSLITPISLDHSEHLGNSLPEIAAEKAGIIKPGVPVVVGKQSPDVVEVFLSSAAGHDAPVHLAERDFSCHGCHDNLSVDAGGTSLEGLSCALPGKHQLDNFAQAVAGALLLREQGLPVSESAIRKAGKTIHWPGRLEWLGKDHKVLLDVSHNRAGIDCLADFLAEQNVSRIHLITGLSGERKPEEVLMPLVQYAAAIYAVPVSYGRSVPTKQVVSWARKQNLSVTEYSSAAGGLTAALKYAHHNEPVVACGSLYMVAEIRQELLAMTLPGKVEAAGSL